MIPRTSHLISPEELRKYEVIFENVHATIGEVCSRAKARCILQQCGQFSGDSNLQVALEKVVPAWSGTPALTFPDVLHLIVLNISLTSGRSIDTPPETPHGDAPDQTDVFDYISTTAFNRVNPEKRTSDPEIESRERSGSLIKKDALQGVVSSFGLLFDVPGELSTLGIAGKTDAVISRDEFRLLCDALDKEEGKNEAEKTTVRPTHISERCSATPIPQEYSPARRSSIPGIKPDTIALRGPPTSVHDLTQMLNAIGDRTIEPTTQKKIIPAYRVINTQKPSVRMGHTQVWRKNTKQKGVSQEGQRSEMIAQGVFPPGAPRGKLQGVRPTSGDYVRWEHRVMTPIEGVTSNILQAEADTPSFGRYPRKGQPNGGLLNSLKGGSPPSIELYPKPLWLR